MFKGKNCEFYQTYLTYHDICPNYILLLGMPVRLRGSHSPNIGRVEVYYAGKWGSIHAAYRDIHDATVVCRQLGYSAASLTFYRLFCSAAVAHWFVWFKCNGNESSLDQCPRHFNDYYSHYGYYDGYCASVVCKDKMADSGKCIIVHILCFHSRSSKL